MATSKHQRIGIWIIAVVMLVGTIFSFFAIILANNNDQADYKKQQEEFVKQQKMIEEEQKKHLASLKPLDGYTNEAFDAESVKELKVETLVQGEGKEAKADSTVNANYFGWTADGKMFDSTNKNGTTTPIDFSLAQVIEGWTKGLTGVKEGSVVKLMIPTDQAYGPTAAQQGRPAGPLAFIVELKQVKETEQEK